MSLMFSLRKNIDNSYGLLLTPSWLSMVICLAAGLLIVLGSITMLHYQGSDTELFVYQSKVQSNSQHSNNEHGRNKSITKEIISDAPLLILWGGIGAIAYSSTMALIRSFKSGYELHEELDYVNVDRHKLIIAAVERLVIKSVALIVWFVFVLYSLHVILPYIGTVISAGIAAGNLFYNVGYQLLAFVIVLLIVHIHTILLRLVTLRPRIFGNA